MCILPLMTASTGGLGIVRLGVLFELGPFSPPNRNDVT